MSDLSRLVFEAGVVGQGGAGFPAHVKYAKPAGLFLINGAECEPLLQTDQYVMLHFAAELVEAALAVQAGLGAARVIFALKDHYREQITALRKAIGKNHIELCLLESVYPAGDEQVLLYEAAGLLAAPGGIPIDVGAVVSNAGTLLSVGEALKGRPLTHKYLTMAGEVADPVVLRVPIGMSFADCIDRAGGTLCADYCVIAGGPVMGRPIEAGALDDEVVTKTTSGIIVLKADHYLKRRRLIPVEHMKNRARAACIQCSMCSDLCPRRLLGSPLRPHLVMRAYGASADMDELLEKEAAQYALYCCECGICEMYSCPMELQPCRINIVIKEEMRRRGVSPAPLSTGAGASPDWPYRRIPSERMAARTEVLQYLKEENYRFEDVPNCARVSIPLKMHTGSPSVPCV